MTSHTTLSSIIAYGCADSDHRWMSVDYPYGIAINNPFSNSAFFFLVKTVYDFVGDHNNITIDSSFQITS